jgi:3-methylcrotonyl-CoA carboxylase alpha subunit
MNGTMVSLLVNSGEQVTKGTSLLVMEAMKMEHNIKAPCDGTVSEFYFQPGDLVDGGAEVLAFDESKEQ